MSAYAETAPLRQTATTGYTMRDLLTAVFYHKRALALAFCIPFGLGLLAAAVSKTVYVAQARLLVLLGNEYVFQPTGSASGSGISLDRNQIVQGELEILQSTTLAIETLRTLGVERVYPRTDQSQAGAMALAADRLEKDLTVVAVPESNVVELSYRSYSAVVSAEVLKTLIELYIQRRSTVFSRGVVSAVGDQRAIFAARLRAAEEALARFDTVHAISDFDAEVNLLLGRRSVLANDMAADDQRSAELAAQSAALRERLAALPATTELYADSSRAPAQIGLGDALAKLQAQRSALAARYQDGFPLVADTDREIAALKAQIGGTARAQSDGGRRGVNPVYQDLQGQEITLAAQQRGLVGKRAEQAAAAAAIQARLDELNAIGRDYRDLKRSRDALDETYRGFVRETEQTQLTDALARSQAANIRVVQPPEPPARGSNLAVLIAAAGFLLGLIGATAALVLMAALQQSFVNAADAERALDLPVLVAVPLRGARA